MHPPGSCGRPRHEMMRWVMLGVMVWGVAGFGQVAAQDAALIAQGERLFFEQTFAGNGRTCATCHRPERSFALDPAFIATLPPNDPLFVAETNPDDLAELENMTLLRDRGLILVNIDGFDQSPVFRAPPPLFNLAHTAPFGLNSNTPTLAAFIQGAIRQHFPKTLNRQEGEDFRLASDTELAALEAFLRALVLPYDDDFTLDRLLRTEAQQRGRDVFFSGVAKCSECHGGITLSTASEQRGGGNRAFNTGVVALEAEIVLRAADADREFSTPTLLGIRHTAPFFHNNTFATLRAAVEFYNSEEFNASPAATEVGAITMTTDEVDDIVAFLEALTCPPDGDVNRDGQITTADALRVFQQFLGNPGAALEPCQQDQGDVVARGQGLTPADARCLIQAALGLPSCLGGPATIVALGDCTTDCVARLGELFRLPVQVTDTQGEPIAGVAVRFQLGSSTDGIPLNTVMTDANGQAEGLFDSFAIGEFTVTAVAANLQTQFEIRVAQDTGDIIVNVEPCNCQGAVGDIINLGVRVTNAAGNPLAGLAVAYRLSGSDNILASNVTDVNGVFTFPFVSAEPGLFIVIAEVEGMEAQFYLVIGARQDTVGEPIADAGENRAVNLGEGNTTIAVTLDGSGSFDRDGEVATFVWGGTPDPEDIARPMVELEAGVHVFSLEVIDDSGIRSAADTVTIIVNEGEGPVLAVVPERLPAAANGAVTVPIHFTSNGNAIRAVRFVIDFDETLLTFDPTDANGDGLPDAVMINASAFFARRVTFDPSATDGELTISLLDDTPPFSPLPDSVLSDGETVIPLLTILLGVGAPPDPVEAAISLVPLAVDAFENTDRQNIPGTARGGVAVLGDRDDDGIPDALEATLGLDPDSPDTDGDGILDGDEDFDGDGLSNAGEAVVGTDPTNADSDNNGIVDGQEDPDRDGLFNPGEIQQGTDPFTADSDGDGWIDGAEVDDGSNPLDATSRPDLLLIAPLVLTVTVPGIGAAGGLPLNVIVGAPPLTVTAPGIGDVGGLPLNVIVGAPPLTVTAPGIGDVGGLPLNVIVGAPPVSVTLESAP